MNWWLLVLIDGQMRPLAAAFSEGGCQALVIALHRSAGIAARCVYMVAS